MKKYLLILILSGLCFSAFAEMRSYSAGPIWNDNDARAKCPAVCTSHRGSWNGQWRTVAEGQNSTCDCVKNGEYHASWGAPGPRVHIRQCQVRAFRTGPIWNNDDANFKCPQLCSRHNARWTRQWWTVQPGRASVCQCRRCFIE